MPPQSRGVPIPAGFHSWSTPNLPTLRTLRSATTADGITTTTLTTPSTLSEAAPIEDYSLDPFEPTHLLQPPVLHGSTSSSSSESDNEPIKSLPQRPLYNHASRSHSYVGPSAFAPPFYNRPPTPLPPSPSLTSLLRPAFSAHPSRPSTPDPSSDEGTTRTGGTGGVTPNNNSAAAASTLTSSFRTARPIPRASPKVPTYEYYGFTLYLASGVAFAIYLLWSYLPSPFLHQLGIYYYPNRWWSLAIPAWLVMAVVWVYVALAAYNTGSLTLALQSVECLVDEAAQVAVVDRRGRIVRAGRAGWRAGVDAGAGLGVRQGAQKAAHQSDGSGGRVADQELDWRSLWNEGTDAVMDVPIGGVCEVLYGGHEHEHEYGDD